MAITKKQKSEQILAGVPASPGIIMGKVFLLSGDVVKVAPRALQESEILEEVEKFRAAVAKAKQDIQKLREKAANSLGEESAQIFQAHQLMLEDDLIIDETVRRIQTEKINADLAFFEIMEKFETSIANFQDEHFKSRAIDLRDVKRRVIHNIQGNLIYLLKIQEPAIIVARELTPSDTVNLNRDKVLGFATDFGGSTSHVAIMARSMKVPSVVGLLQACQSIQTGDWIILDGNEGTLVVHPTPETTKRYQQRLDLFHTFEKKLDKIKNLPARTKDGKDIELSANIEFEREAANVSEMGGDGVGLYRTEYHYLARQKLPDENELFNEYARAVKALKGKPIIFRTADLGGDKLPRSIEMPPEENPFLGMRAIRLFRNQNQDIFKTQLRAIVRASAFGRVRILFPMISCVSEIRYCQNLLKETKDELKQEGVSFSKEIPVGAMIEVPSSAVIADLIAEECDFLSIGTNDLIQYSLAVDRGNEHVAYLYNPFNPAILRMIREIIHKGHQKGVWVGMCGEMASDPLSTMLLIGMSLDEFSVSLVSLLMIKAIIRRVDYSECENLAQKALNFTTTRDVDKYLRSVFSKKFRDIRF
ncbi:MAG: phosphoenolpyruvate--protein phosphotransferase [Actinobacteria bacterium]|nr:phosphoenolpyruvate--protein phosphotransferase [Actinomycetota bacterium]